MAVYKNTGTNPAITSVEFTPTPDGNFTFVYVDPAQKDAVKSWLASADVGQEIVAESKVNDRAVLITQGDKSKQDIIKAFASQGADLQLVQKDRKFNPWKMRGLMSMIGQPLQILSGYLQKGSVDGATITFGVTNMTANVINMMFGGEKSKDVHRLRFLKQEVNDQLDEHLPSKDSLLSVDDKRAHLRHGPERPPTMGEKVHNFIQRYSVTGGEIGLRYLGSVALAFPISKKLRDLPPGIVKKLPEEIQALEKTSKHWGIGMKQLFSGEFKGAYETLKNTDTWTRRAGLTYLTGKSLAFSSKTPDPYDPKPKSTLDKIREKYTFLVSSWIELGAAGIIAVDRFVSPNRKITIPKWGFIPKKWHGIKQDYLGGIGGALFMGGFIIRLFAPFGSKELNMEELNAHITDTLAKTPPEKIPQLMADTAATVTEHMQDKKLNYGEVYTKMVSDMYRYHHIATLGSSKDKPLASPEPLTSAVPETPTTEAAATPSQSERIIIGRRMDKENAPQPADDDVASRVGKRPRVTDDQPARSYAEQEALRKAFELHPPTNSIH